MKGVIIAAGYGTRFLPASKTIPKEMFPLIDTPAIDIIIDEFEKSGIKDILIVTSRRKKALDDYFDREIELETVFKNENNSAKLELIKQRNVNIFFVRQSEMKGTGHAILICKEFLKDSPFVIAYPDDLVFGDIPLAKQLIDVHHKTGGSVLSVMEVEGDVSRYGVVDASPAGGMLPVRKIVEKPAKGTEPSKLISLGRYLFTPELFELLERDYKNHKGGEFYHISAINELASQGKLFASLVQGDRVDVGDKAGYLEGIIKYALSRADLKDDAQRIINNYSKK